MSEIEKLDTMLTEMNVNHTLLRRFPEMDKDFPGTDWGWQLTVDDKTFGGSWDVICGRGSYGCEKGLLELMGDILDYPGVKGYMTADEVMELAKAKAAKEKRT